MKNVKLKFGLVGVGTVLFHFLFWKENIGINLLLFSLFAVIVNCLVRKSQWNKNVVVTSIGLFISLSAVFFIHSTISIIAAITSLIVCIGFLHHKEIRMNWYSLMTIVTSVFQLPKLGIKESKWIKQFDFTKWKRSIKLFVLPVLVLIVFLFIFRIANPVFESFVIQFENWIGNLIEGFFFNLSFSRILFFIFGFFLTTAIVLKSSRTYFIKKDSTKSENIIRKRVMKRRVPNHVFENGRSQLKMEYPTIPILGLKQERTSAIIMFALVVGLLSIVNTIDIVYIWFNEVVDSTKSLSEILHDGTYLLMFSILLSMVIMLYVFRKNQNFYTNNKRLKQFANAWIIQNGILIISVVIRNYNYISEYGLTHKRIGVYIFLFLTAFGLVFLYLKIKNKKSIYYLMLNNSWVVYGMLVFMGIVNWDGLIVTYNLNYLNPKAVDYTYLVQLSDNALISIDENKALLGTNFWYSSYGRFTPANLYQSRIEEIQKSEKQSAISWNYSTYKIKTHFSSYPLTGCK